MNRFNMKYPIKRRLQQENDGFCKIDEYLVYEKPFFMRSGSIDTTLAENIIIDECYQPNLWFNRNLREEFIFNDVNCIIDAGANIGLASCYFANVFASATIYAFEPEIGNYELLCRNTEPYTNIVTYNEAIWKDSNGVFITNRNSIKGHSGKPNPAKFMVGNNGGLKGEKRIKSIKLSDFMDQNNIFKIDILKMDIQGSEIEAFKDSREWLPNVRLLFIETHDLFRRGCSNEVFSKIASSQKFAFIGSPNGEILVFLNVGELLS